MRHRTLLLILAGSLGLAAPAAAQVGSVNTVAGGGVTTGPGGLGTIGAIAEDPDDGTYVVSSVDLNRVFVSTGVGGSKQLVAGSGFFAFGGDGGPAVDAALAGPSGLAIDRSNHHLLYIADTGNRRVRRVDRTTGEITTVFGSGICSETTPIAGDLPALTVNLCRPTSIASDLHGDLYVFDSFHRVIYRLREGEARLITDPLNPFNNSQSLTESAKIVVDSRLHFLYVSGVTPNSETNPADGAAAIRRIALPGAFAPCPSCGTTGPVPVDPQNIAGGLNIAVDGATGDLYFDDNHNAIKRFQRDGGTIVTVAGGGLALPPYAAGLFGVGQVNLGALSALAFHEGLNPPADNTGLLVAQLGFISRTNVPAQGTIQTILGDGTRGFCGDGGAATSACLSAPTSFVVGDDGRMVIADAGNDILRVVDSSGVIQSLEPTRGKFGPRVRLAWRDASHTGVYVSSWTRNRVFAVDLTTGASTVFAGNGCTSGSIGTLIGDGPPCGPNAGDGGPAVDAEFSGPEGIAVDGAGHVFVADYYRGVIRRIDAAGQQITTVAGGGIQPVDQGLDPLTVGLDLPAGLAFSPEGDLLIATSNSVLRLSPAPSGLLVSGGEGQAVNRLAGSNDSACPSSEGPALGARLCFPSSVTSTSVLAVTGELGSVQRIELGSDAITTILGAGSEAREGLSVWRTSAGKYIAPGAHGLFDVLDVPIEVALAAVGNDMFLYYADIANHRIRRVLLGPAADHGANHPPFADAGGSRTIFVPSFAGATVLLSGAASFDVDNDPLTYSWSEGGQALGGLPAITPFLSTGIHTITLTVRDAVGGVGRAEAIVTVLNDSQQGQSPLVDVPALLTDPFFTSAPLVPGNPQPGRLIFHQLLSPGPVRLTRTDDLQPPPPPGLQAGSPPFYYRIETTAQFTGGVQLCIDTRGMSFANPSAIQLYRFADPDWVPLAGQQRTVGRAVCGETSTLGTFAIFYPQVPETAIRTVAGNGFFERSIDGPGGDPLDDAVDAPGAALASVVSRPAFLALDRARQLLYTTDASATSGRIRRIDLATGVMQTIVGPQPFAEMNGQAPIALDAAGANLYYIAELPDPASGGRSELIVRRNLSSGVSTVVAMLPDFITVDALALDPHDTVFAAAANRVYRVNPVTGQVVPVLVTTGHSFPGALSTPFFDQPHALAFDRQGALLVGGMRLLRVLPGADGIVDGSPDETFAIVAGMSFNDWVPATFQPFAGNGLPATQALTYFGYGLVVASDGAVVFGDGQGLQVRRIAPGTDGVVNGGADEIIETIAGYYGVGLVATDFATSRFGNYRGVVENANGRFLVADYTGHRVLEFGVSPFVLGGVQPGGADLSIQASALQTTVHAASPLVYSVTVANDGPSAAAHVSLTMPLAGAAVVHAPALGVCSFPIFGASGTLNCDLGPLGAGHVTTFIFSVTPTVTGTLTAVMSVSSEQTDPQPGNNTASVTVTVTDALPLNVNAGPDQEVSTTNPAGTTVHLSGNGSDPDGDALTFSWTEGGTALGSSAALDVMLSVGSHILTLTVSDGWHSASDTVQIDVARIPVSDLGVAVQLPAIVGAGVPFQLTVVIANAGPDGAPIARLNVGFAAGLTPVGATVPGGVCSVEGGVLCDVEPLGTGSPAIATITAIATRLGTLPMTFTVSTINFDPENSNNTTVAAVVVNGLVVGEVIHVTDTPGPPQLPILEVIRVTDTVASTGLTVSNVVTASNLSIFDTIHVSDQLSTPDIVRSETIHVTDAVDIPSPFQTIVILPFVFFQAFSSNGTLQPVFVQFEEVTLPGFLTADVMPAPPPLPAGWTFLTPVFDILTTGTATGATVCIAGSGFTNANQVMHFESGAWISRPRLPSSSSTLTCGGPWPSLSPFVVARRITVNDSLPPVVKAPSNITVPATSAAGATAATWPTLAAFITGGSATDLVDPSPVRLAPQVNGVDVTMNTTFPIGKTTTVTFRFKDASGNIGSATAKVIVVLGTPKIAGRIVANGTVSGMRKWFDVELANVGDGNARQVDIDLLVPVPLKGIAIVRVASPLPIHLGNLDAGARTVVRVMLDVPAAVKLLSLSEVGTLRNVKGTVGIYLESQTVVP